MVHGITATGKTAILKSLLPVISTPYAIIDSQECITARHLFERTLSSCSAALRLPTSPASPKCETISLFAAHLETVLSSISSFTLVFDNIDRQREGPPTLLSALSRLGERNPSLTTILILSVPRPRYLHFPSLPHVHFLPYSKSQLLNILAQHPVPNISNTPSLSSHPSHHEPTANSSDSLYVWTRFTSAVYDSLALPTARDLVSFRSLCEHLWPAFIAPIVAGTYGPRDFSKLVVAQRHLLRSEATLVQSIVPATSAGSHTLSTPSRHSLPSYSKILLIAAYLASHSPARQDATYFMQSATSLKKKKRQSRKTSKSSAKNRTIGRRLLGPQTFVLERLLAIFHAIVPKDAGRETTGVDILASIATLASLRLLIKTSVGADVLGSGSKWRVNVGWDMARGLGREVGVEVEAWIGE